MRIRKTKLSDLDRIMHIYEGARRFMAEHGNPRQWGNNLWPPKGLIERDVAEGHSYVCENDAGETVGTFFFVCGRDVEPCYRIIRDGEWTGGDSYGVVHRIASDFSEKGIGSFCLNWAYENCKNLRIDTHGDNYVMQSLLRKLGFRRCGIIYVEQDPEPRIAFEKTKENT